MGIAWHSSQRNKTRIINIALLLLYNWIRYGSISNVHVNQILFSIGLIQIYDTYGSDFKMV